MSRLAKQPGGCNTRPCVHPQTAANQASAPSTALEALEAEWLSFIKDIYRNLHEQTFFLPPLHFCRVPHSVQSIAGQSVIVWEQPPPSDRRRRHQRYQPYSRVPQVAGRVFTDNSSRVQPWRLQDSDLQDDQAQKHVLQCLRALSENNQQVMMVISQLKFRKYLKDISSNPLHAAAVAMLSNLTSLPANLADGECDILIIFRLYGLLVGEIKSVGGNQRFAKSTKDEQHRMIVDTVKKAVTQLNNQGTVLGQLVSDMPLLKVTKVLFLPNVTSSQLLQALNTDPAVSQALCQCLNDQDVSVAVSRCLCVDQMPAIEDLHAMSSTTHLSRWARLRTAVLCHGSWLRARLQRQSADMSQLYAWWQYAVLDSGPDPNMSAGLYERLLARFCGPATTVDIPTVTPPRKVVRSEAQAVAETGLTMSSLALYPDQVHLLNRTLNRVFLWGGPGTGKTVVLVLKALQLLQSVDVQLVSICDEGRAVAILMEQQIRHSLGAAPAAGTLHRHHFDFGQAGEVTAAVNKLSALSSVKPLHIIMDEVPKAISAKFTEFYRQLDPSVLRVIWAAGVFRPNPLPTGMCLHTLTVPLRCPPVVAREVEQSGYMDDSSTPRYSSAPTPAVTDGPAVRRLQHTGQSGHSEDKPQNCELCGQNIAAVLRELRVGEAGHGLQWRDVIVLCRGPSDSLPLVQALRGGGVPVKVVQPGGPDDDVHDLALAATDHVIVTDGWTMSGLERRVVVGMRATGNRGRLEAVSRCSAQLVWIDQPGIY